MVAEKLIEDLEVYCVFLDCDWIGPLRELDTHKNDCKFHPIKVYERKMKLRSHKEMEKKKENLIAKIYNKCSSVFMKIFLGKNDEIPTLPAKRKRSYD